MTAPSITDTNTEEKMKMTIVSEVYNILSEDAQMDAVVKADATQDLHHTLAIIAPAVGSAPDFFATVLGYLNNPIHIYAALIMYMIANLWTHWSFCVESLRRYTKSHSPSPAIKGACAAILREKLQKLEITENREQNEENEASTLYITTALLLKESIINIDDIYTELSPGRDHELVAENMKWRSDMKKKADAISMEEMTGDTKAPASENIVMQDFTDAPVEMTRPNQKVELLAACLATGEVKTAMALLTRMPKVTATRPSLADSICCIIRFMVSNLYDTSSADACPGSHPSRQGSSQSLLSSSPEDRANVLAIERVSVLPQCSSIDDFTMNVKPLLEHVGARIYRDLNLVGILCQIGASALFRLRCKIKDLESVIELMAGQYDLEMKHRLTEAKGEYSRVEAIWGQMSGRLFLPALTRAGPNTELVAAVWQLLQCMDRGIRVRVYRRWQRSGLLDPELLLAFAQNQAEAMSALRHIDMESTHIYGPKIACLVLSSPQVIFAAVMNQVEKSNDKFKTIVSAFRYFTGFGCDLFDFALLEYIAEARRFKFQANGMPAKWMKDLAAFCALLYRECPSAQVEFVLRHILGQLRKNDPGSLVILSALLCTMGGVEDMNIVDPAKMAGGVSLLNKAILGAKGAVASKELKSSQRMRAAMIHERLGTHLLVALSQCCQQFQNHPQAQEASHNRITGIAADQMYAVKLQLIDYLSTNLQHEFHRLFPSLPDLCRVHGMEAGMALTLFRSQLQDVLHKHPAALASRVSHVLAGSRAIIAIPDGNNGMKRLDSIVQEVSSMFPQETWSRVSPQFFVTFWQLSIYDIFVPEGQYRTEIKKCIDIAFAFDDKYGDYNNQEAEPSETERKDLLLGVSRLRLEMQDQNKNKKRVVDRLNKEKNQWFLGLVANRAETMHLVAQYCISARAKVSGVDAVYCAKFVTLLYTLTPEIWGVDLYSKMFEQLQEIVPNATVIEACSYGYFLREILADLAKLCEEALLETDEAILDYVTFQSGLHEWFGTLFKACDSAIATGNFVPIRNANLILSELSPCCGAICNVLEALFLQAEDAVLDWIVGDLKLKVECYIHKTSEIIRAPNTAANNHTIKETGKRGITKKRPHILSSDSTPAKKCRYSASSAVGQDRRSGTSCPVARPDLVTRTVKEQMSGISASFSSHPEPKPDHRCGAAENHESGGPSSASGPSRRTALGDKTCHPKSSKNRSSEQSAVPLEPKAITISLVPKTIAASLEHKSRTVSLEPKVIAIPLELKTIAAPLELKSRAISLERKTISDPPEYKTNAAPLELKPRTVSHGSSNCNTATSTASAVFAASAASSTFYVSQSDSHSHRYQPLGQCKKLPQASGHIPCQRENGKQGSYNYQETKNNDIAPSLDEPPAKSSGTIGHKRAGDYLDRNKLIGTNPEASKKSRLGDIERGEHHQQDQLLDFFSGPQSNHTRKTTMAQADVPGISASSVKVPVDTPLISRGSTATTSNSTVTNSQNSVKCVKNKTGVASASTSDTAFTKSGDSAEYVKETTIAKSASASAITSQGPKERNKGISQASGNDGQPQAISGRGSRKRAHDSMVHSDPIDNTLQEGKSVLWMDSIKSQSGSVEDLSPNTKKIRWVETLEEWDSELLRATSVPSVPDNSSSHTSAVFDVTAANVRGDTSTVSPLKPIINRSPMPILKWSVKSPMGKESSSPSNTSPKSSSSSVTSSSDPMPAHHYPGPAVGRVASPHPHEQILREADRNRPAKRFLDHDGSSKARPKKVIKINRGPLSILL
ncbi:THO complex subunit 2 [Podila epicladia]|nr:THO complex subunit 2 [Podila epicladia]